MFGYVCLFKFLLIFFSPFFSFLALYLASWFFSDSHYILCHFSYYRFDFERTLRIVLPLVMSWIVSDVHYIVLSFFDLTF